MKVQWLIMKFLHWLLFGRLLTMFDLVFFLSLTSKILIFRYQGFLWSKWYFLGFFDYYKSLSLIFEICSWLQGSSLFFKSVWPSCWGLFWLRFDQQGRTNIFSDDWALLDFFFLLTWGIIRAYLTSNDYSFLLHKL